MANTQTNSSIVDAAKKAAASREAASGNISGQGGIKGVNVASQSDGSSAAASDSGSQEYAATASGVGVAAAASPAEDTSSIDRRKLKDNKNKSDALSEQASREGTKNNPASSMDVKSAQTQSKTNETIEDRPDGVTPGVPGSKGGYVDTETGDIVSHGTSDVNSLKSTSDTKNKRSITRPRSIKESVIKQGEAVPGKRSKTSGDIKALQQAANQEFFDNYGRYPIKNEVGYNPSEGSYFFRLDPETKQARIVEEDQGNTPFIDSDLEIYKRNKDYLTFRNATRKPGEDNDKALLRNRRDVIRRQEYKVANPNLPGSAESEVVTLNSEGDTVDPTVYDIARFGMKRAADRNRQLYLSGGPYFEKDRVSENGGMYLPEDSVEERLTKRYMKKYGVSEVGFRRMVMLRLGIGVDKSNQILNENWAKFKLSEEDISYACVLMDKSQEINGHPLGRVDSIRYKMGGSVRYSIPIYTDEMAEELTSGSGILVGKFTKHQLKEKGREEWQNNVKPQIMANCTGDKLNQRYALEHLVRSLVAIDGEYTLNEWSLTPLEQASFDELMDNAIDLQKQNNENDSWQKDVGVDLENTIRTAKNNIKNRNFKEIKDSNGNIVDYKRRFNQSKVSRMFMSWGNLMRFCGVVGNVPLIISGFGEHLLGNAYSFESNFILNATLGHESAKYELTPTLRKLSYTEEAKEAISVYKALERYGGADATIMFSATGYAANTDNLKKFLAEVEERTDTKPPGRLRELAQKLSSVTDILVPGDLGFRGQDAHLFMNSLAYCMGSAAINGQPSMTTRQLEEVAVGTDGGIGKLITEAMKYPAGREAFVQSNNQTFNRISPLGHAVNKIMRANGVTNWLVTAGLDTYISYGVNMMQLIVPFSNTMSYLAVKGGIELKRDSKGNVQTTIQNYQLGANEATFWAGFKKNFIYDAVRLSNISLIAAFAYCIIGMLGFEDPDDDKNNMFCADEYKIGGKIGLGPDTDGDGKGNGIPIRLAWWANDLVQWGWPLAISAHVRNLHKDDQTRATAVFWDSMSDMVSGSSVLDMIDAIVNVNEHLDAFEGMSDSEDVNKPADWDSRIAMIGQYMLAQSLGKSTPSIVRNWNRDTFFVGKDARDRSTSRLWKDKDLGTTKANDDKLDVLVRGWSKFNPAYAMLQNFFHYGTPIVGEDSNNTGYLFNEMPIATMGDQVALQDFNDLEIPDYYALESKGWSAEEIESFYDDEALKLIETVRSWGTGEDAVQAGHMIPYNARENAINYCYKMIALNNLDWDNNGKTGWFGSWNDYQQANSEYYDLLSDYFKNEDIPWSSESYEKLLSDYQVIYRNKQTGELTTAWDELNPFVEIEKTYIPYGNHPTSFAPFTAVDYEGRGFNAETIPYWMHDGVTDTSSLFNEAQSKIVGMGRDEGKQLASAIFGGYSSTGDESNPEGYYISPDNTPTIGYRSYVPSDSMISFKNNGGYGTGETNGNKNGSGNSRSVADNYSTSKQGSLPNSLKNITLEMVMAAMGLDSDNNDSNDKSKNQKSYGKWNSYGGGSSYTGGRSYSGGYGGYSYRYSNSSSYNPKIYSNPRSINANKAASMYTKTPYGATTSYLRPNFATKGSREAYKRSDI